MSDENSNQSSSAMVAHLQRYQTYMDNLKRGHSSGISGAFGSALDLLPVEMRTGNKIAPARSYEEGEQLSSGNGDRGALRSALETLIESSALEIDALIGRTIETDDGEAEIVGFFLDGGESMFMLSNMSIISESNLKALLASNNPNVENCEKQTSDNQSFASLSTSVVRKETEEEEEEEEEEDDDDNDDVDRDQALLCTEQNSKSTSLSQLGTTALVIKSPAGARLWTIYFDQSDVTLIEMADGSLIKRAEGRNDLIMAIMRSESTPMFYILSGFFVDPTTGNIYVDANGGAYTSAFMNNGWQVEQFRNEEGQETFYITAPTRTGAKKSPVEVKNLSMDIIKGEVLYESLDGSVTGSLRSRAIHEGG